MNTIKCLFQRLSVDQRGSDYSGLKYAIIKSSDVHANGQFTNDLLSTPSIISFTTELCLETKSYAADGSGIAFYYDDGKEGLQLCPETCQ